MRLPADTRACAIRLERQRAHAHAHVHAHTNAHTQKLTLTQVHAHAAAAAWQAVEELLRAGLRAAVSGSSSSDSGSGGGGGAASAATLVLRYPAHLHALVDRLVTYPDGPAAAVGPPGGPKQWLEPARLFAWLPATATEGDKEGDAEGIGSLRGLGR
jgi:hypothetical protein